MPLVKLTAPAGVVTDITDYQAGLRYTDSDKIRFRKGAPEKIGGWVKREAFSSTTLSGVCRSIFNHRDSTGKKFNFYGTSTHVFMEFGDSVYDITPFRTDTQTLSNPFTTGSAGSSTVTVTDANHGVTSTTPQSRVVIESVGSGTTDGVTITAGEYFVEFLTANSYNITAVSGGTGSISGTASSGSTSGGGTVTVRYLTNNGPSDATTGFGWGAGTYALSTWGTARTIAAGIVLEPRVWSFDSFGEDVIASTADGTDTIYYFDISAFLAGTSTYRGVTLSHYVTNTLSGDATQIPTKTGRVLVSTPDRHICVFGCNPQGSTDFDETTIRFSSQESLSTWNADITNTSGSQKLGTGSRIVSATKGRGQMYVWTDRDLYSMQFVGPPFTFSFQQLSEASGSLAPKAPGMVEGLAYWMGLDNFYVYDGAVKTLECPVRTTVFDNINNIQREKVFAAVNTKFQEVWWFYPSGTNTEITNYVIYNYVDNTWAIGSLVRTAWTDSDIEEFPLATDSSGNVFEHENGVNDNTSALAASVETGFFNGDENGDNLIFMSRIIPDTTFFSGSQIKFQMKSKRYPNGSEITKGPFTLSSSTTKLNLRSRGRSFQVKYFSDAADTSWRLGTWRAEGQADGTR